MLYVVMNKLALQKFCFYFTLFKFIDIFFSSEKDLKTDRDRLFFYFFDKQKDASAGTPRKRSRITEKLW